jgi:hypothetical protein
MSAVLTPATLPRFVRLTDYLHEHCRADETTDVWINPKRVGYLRPRTAWRSEGQPRPVLGTRLFFAEDGVLEVAELPDQVLALIAQQPC